MLVAPEPGPVLDAVLSLVEGSKASASAPLLRGGVARGEALRAQATGTGAPSTSPRV